MSLLTYLPSFFTNILRLYYGYDVNCQKTFGILSNLASFVLSLYTWLGYKNKCFSALFNGVLLFDRSFNLVGDQKLAFFYIDFGWGPGPGYNCIVAATVLKLVDIACHMLLRTPTITRSRQEQIDYENRCLLQDDA